MIIKTNSEAPAVAGSIGLGALFGCQIAGSVGSSVWCIGCATMREAIAATMGGTITGAVAAAMIQHSAGNL